jgi:hypothetical protein
VKEMTLWPSAFNSGNGTRNGGLRFELELAESDVAFEGTKTGDIADSFVSRRQ